MSRVRRARPLAALLLILAGGPGCQEAQPPVFEDVSVPASAVRGGEPVDLWARVRDDRAVAGVRALIVAQEALTEPALLDPAQDDGTLESRGLRHAAALRAVGQGLWHGALPLPAEGDLYFYLEAWDDDDALARSPSGNMEGSELAAVAGPTAVQLYRVAVRDDSDPGPPGDLCQDLRCASGERCHPALAICLPEWHCSLPGNECARGARCDEQQGTCEEDPCLGLVCPRGSACDPATRTCRPQQPCGGEAGQPCASGYLCEELSGRCLPQGHCLLPGEACSGELVCDEETGTCEIWEPCAGVTCPEGLACELETGRCLPPPGQLCASCEDRSDCGGAADECIIYGDQRACGRDCRFEPCPASFLCRRYGASLQQCVHASGSCRPEQW